MIASEANAAVDVPLCLTMNDPVTTPATKRRRLRRLGDVDPADVDPSLVARGSSAGDDVDK